MSVTLTDPGEYGWKLIDRTRNGDAQAFGEFYDLHFHPVYAYIRSMVHNRQTAEDLTTDTFLTALQAVATIPREPSSPRDWLLAIAHDAVLKHHRASRHHLTTPDDAAAPGHRAVQRRRAMPNTGPHWTTLRRPNGGHQR